MKTIEEINEIAPYHPCEWQQGYGIWQSGYMQGQKDSAIEQKAIDEKEYTEEMRKLNEEWKGNLEIQREMLIDKACGWLENWAKATEWFTIGESIEMLRKAMEE